jgi:serine phosphatase RsbU (regulator of sigma subunit)
VLIDPTIGRATVACAGHKMPLLRLSRGDGRLRSIHPDGIALGFDKGPVFERRLEVAEIAIEPDDRLVLTNSALLSIRNPDGRELGEKAFFSRVAKHAQLETTAFLKALRRDVEGFVGEAGVSSDISLVTITRVS